MPTPRCTTSPTLALCATVAVMLLVPSGARAQVFPFFGNQGPFLNKADFAMADAAARKLLDPQPVAKGTVEHWGDPATGNSGSLTMGRAYRKNGHDCRAVSWLEVFKAGPTRTVQLDTCHIAGTWKLM